ncbi:hypothetical protein CHARACLAT_010544 [Characodon lateralis]|uniref:Uncharacterized protein n=1 Tax=Characodon lateralis TaxID=208331 RepID=A0ABU7EV03_9TELE|nr:hypothetical protein [Characodon lateralis]
MDTSVFVLHVKEIYIKRKVSGQDKAFVCGPSRTMRITTDIRVCVDGWLTWMVKRVDLLSENQVKDCRADRLLLQET